MRGKHLLRARHRAKLSAWGSSGNLHSNPSREVLITSILQTRKLTLREAQITCPRLSNSLANDGGGSQTQAISPQSSHSPVLNYAAQTGKLMHGDKGEYLIINK